MLSIHDLSLLRQFAFSMNSVVFARIETELRDLMAKKGYKSISDFQGKLKEPALEA